MRPNLRVAQLLVKHREELSNRYTAALIAGANSGELPSYAGIDEDELRRLKARIKSSLIMQQESSASRASSIAADWYHLHRILTMEEIGSIIDGLTCESINAYLASNLPERFTIVTLGEKELEVSDGVL